jgi:hypothetical protein
LGGAQKTVFFFFKNPILFFFFFMKKGGGGGNKTPPKGKKPNMARGFSKKRPGENFFLQKGALGVQIFLPQLFWLGKGFLKFFF